MFNKIQTFKVDKDITLLEAIYNFKKDLSKKTIKNYIKNNMVKVNNKTIANSSYLLHKNDSVEISYNKKVINEYNLNILYEDDYLIAIDKPYGLLSISNNKEKNVTAYRMVSDYMKKNNKKNKIFVIHRLDQDTSGVLMFAKNQNIQKTLQNNWNTITKKREYIAITSNKLEGNGTIESYLTENKEGFIYSTKNKEIGSLAITHYKVLKRNNHYSLVDITIDTGKRNQIRVHLSEKGYPIIGDKKYKSKDNSIKRLCLHANTLEFIHPITKKLVSISSPIPKEFNKLI